MSEEFRSFRQKRLATWDIETLEKKSERDNANESVATVTNAIHKAVSIGVSSNLPDFENRFFCRESSSQEAGEDMISDFLEHLFDMSKDLQKHIPQEIVRAAQRLSEKLAGQHFSKGKCEERSLLYHLNAYKKLSVYGFNSGTFSLNIQFITSN